MCVGSVIAGRVSGHHARHRLSTSKAISCPGLDRVLVRRCGPDSSEDPRPERRWLGPEKVEARR